MLLHSCSWRMGISTGLYLLNALVKDSASIASDKEAGTVWNLFLLGCLMLRHVRRAMMVPRMVPMLVVVAAVPW